MFIFVCSHVCVLYVCVCTCMKAPMCGTASHITSCTWQQMLRFLFWERLPAIFHLTWEERPGQRLLALSDFLFLLEWQSTPTKAIYRRKGYCSFQFWVTVHHDGDSGDWRCWAHHTQLEASKKIHLFLVQSRDQPLGQCYPHLGWVFPPPKTHGRKFHADNLWGNL